MNRPNLGRRRFLASSAALAGAALLSPSLLAAAPAKKLTGVNETTLSTVEQEIRAMRAKGRGIIGMKLIGNGEFTSPEDREQSIRYAMQCGLLDAAVIGFASTAEIDEAIERINRALAQA